MDYEILQKWFFGDINHLFESQETFICHALAWNIRQMAEVLLYESDRVTALDRS